MARRIGITLLGLLLVATTASAQRVQASFNVGYGASEGITTNRAPLLGQQFDTLTPTSGASINLTVGVGLTENAEVEFLWARQNSRLQAEGSGGTLPISELAIYNYLG